MAKGTPSPVVEEVAPEILVLGAAGQVGRAITSLLSPDRVVARAREALDICNVVSVRSLIEELRPKIVINLAATNPSRSQYRSCSDEHWQTNAWAVSDLVKTCALNKAALIHLSTVEVFGADLQTEPYKELDAISPRTEYAQSKAAGEHAILAVSQFPVPEFVGFRHWILRTALLYESPTRFYQNALQVFLTQAMRSRDPVPVPGDSYCSSTYVPHLAKQIAWLVDNYESVPTGLYHIANSGHCSLYELVSAAVQRCCTRVFGSTLARCTRQDFQRRHGTPPPHVNQVLDCSSWEALRPGSMPSWQQAISEFSEVYRAQCH